MRIEERKQDGVVVLDVKERRVDARSASDLKDRIAQAVASGSHWIVLNLEEVDFVDSSGLGAIISGLKLLDKQGDLVISGAHDPVSALFKLTRMDKIFRLFPTAEEAVQVLAARG